MAFSDKTSKGAKQQDKNHWKIPFALGAEKNIYTEV